MAATLPLPDDVPPWLGKKRHARDTAWRGFARPLRWPTSSGARREYLNDWFAVAAEVAAKASRSSRTEFQALLGLRRWVDIRTGTCTATNRQIAADGGRLDPTNVSKAIAFFRERGLIVVREDTERNAAGKVITTRTMRLAYPDPFPPEITPPGTEDPLGHSDQGHAFQNTSEPLGHGNQPRGGT